MWLLLLSVLVFAPRADAATETDTLRVTATVETECALTGGTLDFGVYRSGQSSDLDAVGQIEFVNCMGLLTFELDGGQAADVGDRFMSGDGGELRYQLYINSQRSAVWGTGDDSFEIQLFETQSGDVDVYGRIPGGQTTGPGAYVDTVNITLTF